MNPLTRHFKGPIARGTVRTSVVLGLRLVVQAGTLLIVARMLGPGEFGVFAGVAALAVLLGTLSTFGMHLVLLGEVSKDPARREEVLPYAIPATLLCGSLLLGIYWIICRWLLDVQSIAIGTLLLIGVAETLLQPLFSLMVSEHHGRGRVARSQLLNILPFTLRLAAAGLIFALKPGQPLLVYAYGYAAASLLAISCGAFMLPAAWPSWRRWYLPRQRKWAEAFGYAVMNISRAGPTELDKTLALRLLPQGVAGIYAAGARVIAAIATPVTAMMLSALPRLFREGHKPESGALLLWMYAAASIYGVLLAGMLWLAAPVFDIIFGAQYHGISGIIRLLCLAVPALSLRIVAGNTLMALGKPWMRVAFEAAGSAVLLVAAVLLTGKFHNIGMPLALICAEWVMACTGFVMTLKNKTKTSEAQS